MNSAHAAVMLVTGLGLSGCIPGTGSNLVIRSDAPNCVPVIAGVLSAEGFKVVEEPLSSESKLSFEGAPYSGVFGRVYEASASGIRIYFGERSFEFSKAALDQRQRIIDRISSACGAVAVEKL
jgi:hypothetical protein